MDRFNEEYRKALVMVNRIIDYLKRNKRPEVIDKYTDYKMWLIATFTFTYSRN